MILLAALALAAPSPEAQAFLDLYNSVYQRLYTVDGEASWAASTHVNDENGGRRTAAAQALAAFRGDPVVIATSRRLLADRAALSPSQALQLEQILVGGAQNPGNATALVNARIAAETKLAAVQDAFVYCDAPRAADGTCPSPLTANDLDDRLAKETDLARRRHVWEVSKQIGTPLKAGLAETVALRNAVARKNGFSSYFGLMVAEYGMTVPEMMTMLDGWERDMAPLYGALQTWTRYRLALRYGQRPPADGTLPAHWVANRWAQQWDGLVDAAELDPYFVGRSPEWIVKRAEDFYVSLGFARLPPTFWERSDLYPVPSGDPRHKNSHASAWHLDLEQDVRSLMSVQADANWFFTAHHELGHVYYDLAYARPEVPPVLREGANRGFHEGVGELANLAAGQTPYLRQVGILPPTVRIDPIQKLLDEALTQTVVFLPFAVGTMTHFEAELYESDLPPEQWQARWWALVAEHQRVSPPDAARLTDATLCDACTKTHLVDDPAGYYDYAVATVFKYQLHQHIATRILHQDPRACNYAGNAEVGAFLRGILEKGRTEDWRGVLRDATGEDLSTRAMVAYFAPLQDWLEKENAKLAKQVARLPG